LGRLGGHTPELWTSRTRTASFWPFKTSRSPRESSVPKTSACPCFACAAPHRAANYPRLRHREEVSKHGQHTVTSSSLLSLTSMRSSWPWKTGNSVSLVLHGGALYSAAKPGGTHLRQLVLLFEGHHFIAPSTSSAAKRALQHLCAPQKRGKLALWSGSKRGPADN